MTVKVLIKRNIPNEKFGELMEYFKRLRMLATQCPGYISGETLHRFDMPEKYLVISSWQTIEDWRNWLRSAERTEIQNKIDTLLGENTSYEIYHYPSGK